MLVKPSIQALERKTGYVHTNSGKIARGIKSTYKRHGTVQSKITAAIQHPDFQSFLNEVAADVSLNQDIRVTLDNYATHKRNDDWPIKHPTYAFTLRPRRPAGSTRSRYGLASSPTKACMAQASKALGN